jgi:hypothetical protein
LGVVRYLDAPEIERSAMKHLGLMPVFCLLALTLGPLPRVGAETPSDTLWLKAVALSDKNDDLVPGLMKMRMQEVDSEGKPKDSGKYREVWSALSLGADGEVEYGLIKAIENGEDITEEEKAKEEKAKEEERDGEAEGDDSESHEMKGYSPFAPESQPDISLESAGDGGVIGGRSTVLYSFTDQSDDGVVISGDAWLDRATGAPVKIEYTPDPLPKRVKRMVTTMEFEHIGPDSLIVKRMSVEVTGGILFIKKHFHMDMVFDDYWRLPEGYGGHGSGE